MSISKHKKKEMREEGDGKKRKERGERDRRDEERVLTPGLVGKKECSESSSAPMPRMR